MSFTADKKVMSWDAESDQKLLKAILKSHAISVDLEAVGNDLGCTERAVDERIKRLKKIALIETEAVNAAAAKRQTTAGAAKQQAKRAGNNNTTTTTTTTNTPAHNLQAAQARIAEKAAAKKPCARKPSNRGKGKDVQIYDEEAVVTAAAPTNGSPAKKRKLTDQSASSGETFGTDGAHAIADAEEVFVNDDEEDDEDEDSELEE